MTDQPLSQPLARPQTGDAEVDEILESFDAGSHGEAAAQLDAATEAHRRLQARLSTPRRPD